MVELLARLTRGSTGAGAVGRPWPVEEPRQLGLGVGTSRQAAMAAATIGVLMGDPPSLGPRDLTGCPGRGAGSAGGDSRRLAGRTLANPLGSAQTDSKGPPCRRGRSTRLRSTGLPVAGERSFGLGFDLVIREVLQPFGDLIGGQPSRATNGFRAEPGRRRRPCGSGRRPGPRCRRAGGRRRSRTRRDGRGSGARPSAPGLGQGRASSGAGRPASGPRGRCPPRDSPGAS